MELNFTVLNVKCGGCANNIESGLKGMAGIESIDVNIKNGVVKISGNDLSHSKISAKLSELGYPEN